MTKEQAKAILGDMVQEDGHLDDYFEGDFERVWWRRGDIHLNGRFTPDTLEALAFWMRNVKVTV